MKRLDLDQAVVIGAYTGITCCNFADLHAEIEKRLGRPVLTHELASKELCENEIKPAFKDDFLSLCYSDSALAQPEPQALTVQECNDMRKHGENYIYEWPDGDIQLDGIFSREDLFELARTIPSNQQSPES
jgi:hypothetical protein